MEDDCIVRSFHSTFYDIEWLEDRFELFCEKKSQQDKISTLKRLENTKHLDISIVYRELGRCHPAASLFCTHDKVAREAYMDCFSMESNDMREDLAKISIQGGQLAEAIQLKDALKNDLKHHDLYIEFLKLFEVAHMINFGCTEYRETTRYGWILKYIMKYGIHIQNRTLSYADTFTDCGMQLKTLLTKISSLVDSVEVIQPDRLEGSKQKHNEIICGPYLSDFIRKKTEKLQLIK